MLDDYKDTLERALRMEIEVQKIEAKREDRRKSRPGESTNPESMRNMNDTEQKKATTCKDCGKTQEDRG